MATIYNQRIIDGVLAQIQSKEGTDRYNIERSEANLQIMLQQAVLQLAVDSRQFLTTKGIAIADNLIPFEVTPGGAWTNLGGGVVLGSSYHKLPDPPFYIAIRQLLYGNTPMVDVHELDPSITGIQPIYERVSDGWYVAQYDSSVDGIDPLSDAQPIALSYYTYPDLASNDSFSAHPLTEPALIHQMLHLLQARDPYVEFGNEQISPSQFNHASWHQTKYLELANQIKALTENASRPEISTIQPHYF